MLAMEFDMDREYRGIVRQEKITVGPVRPWKVGRWKIEYKRSTLHSVVIVV
jgi:hypothetical protein